jgi:hypothetical protein
MLNILLIEADNQQSLGGSCKRDIINMKETLDKTYKIRQTCVLSFSSFSSSSISTIPLHDYKTQFIKFSNTIQKGDYVIIMISGHGYQKKSIDKAEKDGLDEYIAYGNGIIADNDFRSLVEMILPHEPSRIVCLADTCHSGTMFDIDQIIIPHVHTTILSLSACQDNQYDSCDISSIGFGGALTVHLLSIQNSIDCLLYDSYVNIQHKLIKPLESILQHLGQKPEFYYV